MKWKEHLRITRRSVALLYSLSRRYFWSIVLGSIVTAILPYVPIYFSARLLDALVRHAGVRTLALYAGLTVGLTALLGLANAWIRAQQEIGNREADCNHDWHHAQKAMDLSLASIEDRQVALLRERIRRETQTGFNLFYFLSCFERSIEYVVKIIASLSLTASFFRIDAISLWAKLAFIAGVALTVAVGMVTNRRSTQLTNDFVKSCVQENITLDKYVTYLRHYTSGKDIRLYAMEAPLLGFADRIYRTICAREGAMQLRCSALNLVTTLMAHKKGSPNPLLIEKSCGNISMVNAVTQILYLTQLHVGSTNKLRLPITTGYADKICKNLDYVPTGQVEDKLFFL